jgi:MFS superfamily sulfate permease-like transporter
MLSDAMPGLRLLRSYRREWLRGDLVAGLVLAAYLLPAGLGDASLAGLPPEAGLYACLFAGLVFWLFCSSRHTAVTVTSAISLLVGTSLGDLAGGEAGRYAALASTTALLVALLGLGAVETAAIGRMFARKHGYRLDSNQEFLALAGSNLAAGLGTASR